VLYCAGPGTKDTFKIDVESPLLKDREWKLFHMTVACAYTIPSQTRLC
jgi:hypothetical protein